GPPVGGREAVPARDNGEAWNLQDYRQRDPQTAQTAGARFRVTRPL
ncbi:MAG: hypothetical protein AVDCRST_MAG02-1992, partial [uncultured Rubrobacteraceae bacterium]